MIAETYIMNVIKKKTFFLLQICLHLKKTILPLQSQYGKRPVRLGVRTSGFHLGNRGSIPLRATKRTTNVVLFSFKHFRKYSFHYSHISGLIN